MADQAVHPSSAGSGNGRATSRWRTVDIVVTAVLGAPFLVYLARRRSVAN